MNTLQFTDKNINGLGFRTRDNFKKFAAILYVHHGGLVSSINDDMKEKGLRPMTASELEDFFEHNESTLAVMRGANFLATAPEDIKVSPDDTDSLLVPGIYDNEDGLKARYIIFTKCAGEAMISDHFWFVLGVDDKKTVSVA